jgi:hypothetical protein
MPISIEQVIENINPERTVLLLGSGSSIPSGAPSVSAILSHLAGKFGVDPDDLTLRELTDIIERRRSRSELIASVRELFAELRPTGGLLSLPRFKWKSIFTTNYDDLIERAFERINEPLSVYESNFDFSMPDVPGALRLMKLHGTIDKDVSDGGKSRLIITESDYDLMEEFREYLFDALKRDLAGANLIIVGHSLADPDIREIVSRAVALSRKAMSPGSIYLFMYTHNAERADLYESRGLKVCFGGIDEFAAVLTKRGPSHVVAYKDTDDPLDVSRLLSPITVDVHHSLDLPPHVSGMFNGWPASYGDIAAGNTFVRTVVGKAERQLTEGEKFGTILLGAGGVGKTTAARQIMHNLVQKDFYAWEHKSDQQLLPEEWLRVARKLEQESKDGVLFVDDSDLYLYQINTLFEALAAKDIGRLRVILAAARNRWNPRIKSPALFLNSETYPLQKLDSHEITDLLRLVEANSQVGALVDTSFMGFSPGERRRRLENRCERDVFVCLKNIFASEKFDDIVLREYASLAPEYQDIYKIVAALETSGVQVHRQLIIRLLGIEMTTIPSVLKHLTDIVREETVSKRDGIYSWRGRHSVIMEIITGFKFAESESFLELYKRVVEALNPIYEIEVRTIRELCNIDTGLYRIPDRQEQNGLLAKMISIAPGERVPRHRLIRNLIEMERFEDAQTEIRLFSKDFREDGPVCRYRIILALERARQAPGLLEEDRLVLLNRAYELAVNGVRRFPHNKHILAAFCDVGVEIFKRTKKFDVFDEAIAKMKIAAEDVGDPDISHQIARYEHLITNR